MSASAFWQLESPEDAIDAARTLRGLGYRTLEAHTPYEVKELEPLLLLKRSRVPQVAAAAAIAGIAVAFAILHFTNAVDYPLDVGGRPLDSLPADVPILFETAVLFAALATFFALLVRSGLPQLHRPVFELTGFERVSDDAFFVGIDENELGASTFERACAELPGPVRRLRGAP